MRPRIRSIKPETWQDERIGALSHGARLLFVGLVTLADDEGRFRAPTAVLLGHIFPWDPEAQRKLRDWVGEVKDSGIVLFYMANGLPYGAFRHWKLHQRINRANPSLLPAPPDDDVVRENAVRSQEQFTESSLNNHESIMDDAHSHAQARVPIRSLCSCLAMKIKENDPKAKVNPESARWLTDMRLLLKDRNGDVAEIERVIVWCQQDDFWKGVILSPGSLRRKFTTLVLKANGRNGTGRAKSLEHADRYAVDYK